MKTHYDVDVPGEIVKENTANNPQNTRWWFATEPGALFVTIVFSASN